MMLRAQNGSQFLPPIVNKRQSNRIRSSSVHTPGLTPTLTPLKSAFSRQRANRSQDPVLGGKKKVRWCRQMTDDYEMDEEDRDRQRYERLNLSLHSYINEMQQAKSDMLAYQEDVMMKPFYMKIIEGSLTGPALVERIVTNKKRSSKLNTSNVTIAKGTAAEIAGNQRRKKLNNKSFVLITAARGKDKNQPNSQLGEEQKLLGMHVPRLRLATPYTGLNPSLIENPVELRRPRPDKDWSMSACQSSPERRCESGRRTRPAAGTEISEARRDDCYLLLSANLFFTVTPTLVSG